MEKKKEGNHKSNYAFRKKGGGTKTRETNKRRLLSEHGRESVKKKKGTSGIPVMSGKIILLF